MERTNEPLINRAGVSTWGLGRFEALIPFDSDGRFPNDEQTKFETARFVDFLKMKGYSPNTRKIPEREMPLSWRECVCYGINTESHTTSIIRDFWVMGVIDHVSISPRYETPNTKAILEEYTQSLRN